MLCCMATNSRKGVSIGPAGCYIGKATYNLVSLRNESVPERRQSSTVPSVGSEKLPVLQWS
jgi:hypothetical protein